MTVSLRLHHVNLRTAHLPEMVAWYRDTLGLTEGWRPAFGFPGAWLYAGETPVVHIVGVETPPAPGETLHLEHFAFAATGPMADFLARLRRLGVPARLSAVPGTVQTQVNIHDPDGNHIHVDFTEQT